MNWLRKVEGRKVPHGLEVEILRRLPRMALAGFLVVLALPVLARIRPASPGVDVAKEIRSVDIFAIASGITLVTALVTVTIGCVVVYIMKGPAYAADSMPVEHADRPAPKQPPSA